MDPHIPLTLRLRFFDAIISPTALFGCAVLSHTREESSKMDVAQRKMLRNILGWRRLAGEDWEVTMHNMKVRLSNALEKFPIAAWSDCIFRMRWKYAIHIVFNQKMEFPRLLADWIPTDNTVEDLIPFRKRGRPRRRWDDDLYFYCKEELDLDHWLELRNFSVSQLDEIENDFVVYCKE
jgi:hypothetical protein